MLLNGIYFIIGFRRVVVMLVLIMNLYELGFFWDEVWVGWFVDMFVEDFF